MLATKPDTHQSTAGEDAAGDTHEQDGAELRTNLTRQTRLNSMSHEDESERMAVICNTCGLPEDLCACEDLAKDSTKIIIRLETRRFRKKGTMIEGLDPKLNNLEGVAKELKNKYACGGTAKDGYIFLQGDHRDTISETLINLGFSESSIELH